MGTRPQPPEATGLLRSAGDIDQCFEYEKTERVLGNEKSERVLGKDALAADQVQIIGDSIESLWKETTTLGFASKLADVQRDDSLPWAPSEPAASSLLQDPRQTVVSIDAAAGTFDEFADGCRIFVWRNSHWHPVSAKQMQQIKQNLDSGKKVFNISDGTYSWTIDTRKKTGWLQTSAAGTERPLRCTPTLFHIEDVGAGLLTKLQFEWQSIVGSATVMSSAKLLAYYRNACSNNQDDNLLMNVVDDLFQRMDFNAADKVSFDKWIHFRLLELQAPSTHAMTQINLRLTSWLDRFPSVLTRFVDLFLQACGDAASMRLTVSQMKDAVRTWIAHASMDVFHRDYIEQMNGLLNSNSDFEEGEMITYYEFLNYLTGQKWESVELYFYDLTKGSAWMWTPIVFGRSMPCLWHCGIVAFGKEYRYGGNIFESTPGQTAFGEPYKIQSIGTTCRTRQDILSFVNRNLAHLFAVDSYQVLTNNSNHFCDALSMYLTNTHIPDEVLQQPEDIMASSAAKLLSSWLPWLRGVLPNQTQVSRTADEEWESVQEDTTVKYEYEDGWTIIARVVKKHDYSCDVLYFSRHECSFSLRQGVSRRAVQPLISIGNPLRKQCLPQRKF